MRNILPVASKYAFGKVPPPPEHAPLEAKYEQIGEWDTAGYQSVKD